MSEYQYYEFQAVDRRLSQQEMAELREISTRATITPNRFVNVYNFGDFGGSPSELMDKYFDAFVYVANWAPASSCCDCLERYSLLKRSRPLACRTG